MHAYEFVNKGDVTLFRCFDEPYISIDKEDMVHVLSATGNWMYINGEVRLQFQPNGEKVKLADYLLNGSGGGEIRHINNNPLDFRKKNLLIQKHAHSPHFIRPLSKRDVPIFEGKSDPDSLRFFHIIRQNHQMIGYFSILPVHHSVYQQFISESIPKEKALSFSTPYENNTDYFHIIYGHFPEGKALFAYIRHYYQQLLFHLQLRDIHIHEAMTFVGDSFSTSSNQNVSPAPLMNPHMIHLNMHDF